MNAPIVWPVTRPSSHRINKTTAIVFSVAFSSAGGIGMLFVVAVGNPRPHVLILIVVGSFDYLKHLPFDYFKIDGDFIRGLGANTTDQLVAFVGIASGMGRKTVAEFFTDLAITAVQSGTHDE
jgi:hypothetical protein